MNILHLILISLCLLICLSHKLCRCQGAISYKHRLIIYHAYSLSNYDLLTNLPPTLFVEFHRNCNEERNLSNLIDIYVINCLRY